MKKFTGYSLHLYTDILFGKDTEKQVASKIREHGGKKILMVYGGGSIKRSDLYDTIVNKLKEEGIEFAEFGGVKPNPLRSYVDKGIETAKREKIDFLLAVGGGSVIDTAKAIALAMEYEGDYWDFYAGKAVPEKMLKVGAVPTISAAGSETSISTVLVDDIGKKSKKAINVKMLRPVFAIMNPELTYTVSAYQTAAGAADILSHTFERFFVDSSSYLADQFAAGLMRSVVKYSKIAVEDPFDYEARSQLMLAGSFSHNDITAVGRSGHSFPVHALESYLSAVYDTPHGAGLAMLMPAWLEYVIKHGGSEKTARIANLATTVFGAEPDAQNTEEMAYEGVKRFRDWNRSVNLPVTLNDLNIPLSDVTDIVEKCRYNADGIVKGYVDLDKKAVEEIFMGLV